MNLTKSGQNGETEWLMPSSGILKKQFDCANARKKGKQKRKDHLFARRTKEQEEETQTLPAFLFDSAIKSVLKPNDNSLKEFMRIFDLQEVSLDE